MNHPIDLNIGVSPGLRLDILHVSAGNAQEQSLIQPEKPVRLPRIAEASMAGDLSLFS